MPCTILVRRIGTLNKDTPMKPAKIQHKFYFKGTTCCIYVSPRMVSLIIDALEDLAEETQLPLETYSIVPNIYINDRLAYIIDDETNVHVVGLTTDMGEFLGEDD